MFSDSVKELKSISCIAVTGVFIAISMIIEMYSIDLQFAKLNFAFVAIAVIGMLFGPSVGFIAGLACDIVGYMVHPSGGFLPIYVLVSGFQGLIYGMLLYRKNDRHAIMFVNKLTQKQRDITLFLRIVCARLIDVVVINIFINTALNLHYGFIPAQAYSAAIIARVTKNAIELVIDLPLLFVILPVCLAAYKRTVTVRNRKTA